MALFSTLTDDFATGSLDRTKWPAVAGTVAVTGGQLKLTGNNAGVRSAATYTIANSAIMARFVIDMSGALASENYWVQFSVHNDPDNWVGYRIGGGWIFYGTCVNGVWNNIGGTYWDTRYVQYAQITHSGSSFKFNIDATFNGGYSSWDPVPQPFVPSQTMYAQIQQSVNDNTVTWVDNVNLPGNTQTVAPATLLGAGTYGAPAIGQLATGAAPAGTLDTETTGAPALSQPGVLNPDSVSDAGNVGAPTAVGSNITPTSIGTTELVGAAQVSQPVVAKTYGTATYGTGLYGGGSTTAGPVSATEASTVGAPTLAQTAPAAPGVTQPTGIAETATVGAPTLGGAAQPTGYSTGLYGAGSYSGTPTGTADSVDPPTGGSGTTSGYGAGLYGGGTYTGTPTTPAGATSGYGSGTYGAGTYPGSRQDTNTGYGAGIYGNGLYQGIQPLHLDTPPLVRAVRDPLHILGIGPWSNRRSWRGAINYGVRGGVAPARPHLQLPGVQTKAFTLRLNDGGEATASCQFARTDAVIVEEMATDLWWRRKDPRTGRLETIGRFNCSHNDLARADDGTITSSLQFQDYRTLLSARMVMKYLTTVTIKSTGAEAVQSQWKKNTPVTEILRWATPTDLGIDLSALDDPDLLGAITQAYDVSPATTIGQVYDQLAVISPKLWEWWVDTPDNPNQAPKLSFVIGQRGQDKGVTLVDYGYGPSPIASWQMRATSDTYANALYFQGKDGGVVTTLPSQVAEFGERDAIDSDGSVVADIDKTTGGTPLRLVTAARQKLAKLADRLPTFTLVLAPGFWRGPSHIDVGDTLALRLKFGRELLAYSYRVTEIGVEIDQVGTETVTLTLGSPLSSANVRSRNAGLAKVIRYLKNYETPAGSLTYDIDTSILTDD